MRRIWIVLLILTILIGSAITWFFLGGNRESRIDPKDRAKITVMPLPANLSLAKGEFVITPEMGYAFKNKPTERLNKAIKRFFENLQNQTDIDFDFESPKLLINFEKSSNGYPSMEDDESYSLAINTSKVILNAKTEIGVLHGLETLLQLVKKQNGTPIFPVLDIEDTPRYPWRGLMIDVSRHWIPKEVILRNIDAMAQVKLNVLHWHLTDYQGFRIESNKFPNLHLMGSNGNYYTQEEVKEVIEYASDRGIRVVPEFDLPGHSSSWLVGYPELGSFPNEEYKIEKKGLGIFSAILDPTKESVYDFLEGFLDEMVTLFPDQYLHLGGDEASSKTWNENSDIQQFMRENDLSDSKELQNYFTKRVQKITSDKGKTMIGWNEILNPNLPKEQILIQSWTNHKSLWDAIKQGHNAILSSGFYLDHKKSAATHYKVDPTVIPGAINIEIDSTKWKSWDTFIEFNETIIEGQLFLFGENENTKAIMGLRDSPVGVDQVNRNGNKIQFELNADVGKIDVSFEIKGDSILGSVNISILELALFGARTGGNDMPGGKPLPEFKKIEPLTPVQESRILGGEACMWSETVDSRTIESRIWPRAAAIAEKLWSPKIETDQVSDMYRRLKVLDKQLENRGIQHTTASIEIIQENIPVEFIKSIKELIDVLQEDYFINRMNIYGGIENFFTYTPLNRMVDAAFPESLKAHTFNETVQNWSKTKNKQLEKVLVIQLEKWIENHQKLIPLFEENSMANEIRLHSEHLAILSKAALRKIKGLESDQDVKQVIEQSKINYGGTLLAVVDGLVSLIQDE